MNKKLRAKVTLRPRLTVPAIKCKNVIGSEFLCVIAVFSIDSLAMHTFVPVQRIVTQTNLKQATSEDWNRQLIVNSNLGLPRFHPPVLISSRNSWHLKNGMIQVFDRALVVDGAKRLEAAFRFPEIKEIPVTIVIDAEPTDELALRARIQKLVPVSLLAQSTERYDTNSPRLTIGTNPIDLKLMSDPFVIPTYRGFAPALLVRRPNAASVEHILVGATSLAKKLKKIRLNHGKLSGLCVSIHKLGPNRTAQYHVEVTTDDSDGLE